MTQQSLRTIELVSGQIRGLTACKISFDYPISAIAGRNGSGKTTVLALAACAFHNVARAGFKILGRRNSYYTFSDFLIQTGDEISPEGIEIRYWIASNQWIRDADTPDGTGIYWQRRQKLKGGRWSDYHIRVERPVIYFGIDRVVPHAEKSVYKSHRYSFSPGAVSGWEAAVRSSVSKVLGLQYDDYQVRTHGKYHLPVVSSGRAKYSGFNMGAGEKAVFEIFSGIYASPPGTLFVIDEVELGLHEHAQRGLIEELKRVSAARRIQVICTTHSAVVLAALPPEGRFLLERIDAETLVTPGITPAYAMGQLAGENSLELDIYVEDEFAATLLRSLLTLQDRQRVNIVPIGSGATIVDQLLARYRELKKGNVTAFVDGDYTEKLPQLKQAFLKQVPEMLQEHAQSWIDNRISALPGPGLPPEVFVIQRALLSRELDKLASQLNTEAGKLHDCIEAALIVDPHEAIYGLAKTLCCDAAVVASVICAHVGRSHAAEFEPVLSTIRAHLSS